jgi:hypothetical protein
MKATLSRVIIYPRTPRTPRTEYIIQGFSGYLRLFSVPGARDGPRTVVGPAPAPSATNETRRPVLDTRAPKARPRHPPQQHPSRAYCGAKRRGQRRLGLAMRRVSASRRRCVPPPCPMSLCHFVLPGADRKALSHAVNSEPGPPQTTVFIDMDCDRLLPYGVEFRKSMVSLRRKWCRK